MLSDDRELVKGNMPTLVLAVLREGPLHGYAIARAIERKSGNVLRCREGTLYPILHALERDGLVAGEWINQPQGRERKNYRLTEAGGAALARRIQKWRSFTSAIDGVIQGGKDAAVSDEPGAGGFAPTPAFRIACP